MKKRQFVNISLPLLPSASYLSPLLPFPSLSLPPSRFPRPPSFLFRSPSLPLSPLSLSLSSPPSTSRLFISLQSLVLSCLVSYPLLSSPLPHLLSSPSPLPHLTSPPFSLTSSPLSVPPPQQTNHLDSGTNITSISCLLHDRKGGGEGGRGGGGEGPCRLVMRALWSPGNSKGLLLTKSGCLLM